MKQLLTILLLTTLNHIFAQNTGGDSWATTKANGSGTLAIVYYEQAGLIQDVNGNPEGLCVEILKDFFDYVQAKHNKKITLQDVGKEPVFTDLLSSTQKSANLLGVTNVTITDERKKILKFMPPFISNPVVLLTHKEAPAVVHFTELSKKLNGYSAELIGGNTHMKYIHKIKKENWPSLPITYGPSGQVIIKPKLCIRNA